MRPITPYSGPASLSKMDGRSREARLIRDTRKALVEHVGGTPSAVQRSLIERAAVLTLQVAMLDAKQAQDGMTERDGRQYLAWCNTLTRLLRQLGMHGAATRPKTIAEYVAGRAA